MRKKIVLVVLAFLAGIAIVLALGGVKFFQVRKAMQEHASFSPPPESVTSLVAKEEDWVPALKAVGSTAAVQGVTVSTDEPGIVHKINFESGQTVKEGDLLVQLEISQEQAQLRSAEAQMRLAGANLLRQQNLLKSRVSSQADYDTAQAQYDQAVAKVEEVKALIDKKTIRAPFLRRSWHPGGQPWTISSEWCSGRSSSVAGSDLCEFLAAPAVSGSDRGGPTGERSSGWSSGHHFDGKINAVDAVIDEATRNVRVQATLPNPKGLLRPGMFVNTEVPLASTDESYRCPCNRDPIRTIRRHGLYHRAR